MKAELAVDLFHWTGTVAPMYIAARTCKAIAIPTRESCPSEEVMAEWLDSRIFFPGHWSIAEHIDFHFAVSGISRVATHQLVRHRHCSYAQQSLRDFDTADLRFVVPPSYADVEDGFLLTCGELSAQIRYDVLDGRPEEDARYLLPLGTASNIVVKLNGRALIELATKRLCRHAQWEIRDVVTRMRNLVDEVCPLIAQYMVPPCPTCTERTCP